MAGKTIELELGFRSQPIGERIVSYSYNGLQPPWTSHVGRYFLSDDDNEDNSDDADEMMLMIAPVTMIMLMLMLTCQNRI